MGIHFFKMDCPIHNEPMFPHTFNGGCVGYCSRCKRWYEDEEEHTDEDDE